MKQIDKEYYLENWPLHYYEITDINEREEVLLEVLKDHPESKEDQRRLELLHKRYGKARLRQRPDSFMYALLMLRQMSDVHLNAMNKRKKEAEFMQYVDDLLLSDELDNQLRQEYRDLIRNYIRVSRKSFSRPAFLGMGKRTNDKVEEALEDDLHIILVDLPTRFHYEKAFEPLREIAREELAKISKEA